MDGLMDGLMDGWGRRTTRGLRRILEKRKTWGAIRHEAGGNPAAAAGFLAGTNEWSLFRPRGGLLDWCRRVGRKTTVRGPLLRWDPINSCRAPENLTNHSSTPGSGRYRPHGDGGGWAAPRRHLSLWHLTQLGGGPQISKCGIFLLILKCFLFCKELHIADEMDRLVV